MTLKQKKFAERYLADCNGTAAYMEVYQTKNEQTAAAAAARLLANQEVKDYISDRGKAITEKAGISLDMVLQQVFRMAFADIRKLYDSNGNLLPIKDIPDDIAASISSIEVDEMTNIKTSRKLKGVTKRIRISGKERALEILCKHVGVYKDPPAGPVNYNFINDLSATDLKSLLEMKNKLNNNARG